MDGVKGVNEDAKRVGIGWGGMSKMRRWYDVWLGWVGEYSGMGLLVGDKRFG